MQALILKALYAGPHGNSKVKAPKYHNSTWISDASSHYGPPNHSGDKWVN